MALCVVEGMLGRLVWWYELVEASRWVHLRRVGLSIFDMVGVLLPPYARPRVYDI